MQSINIIKVKGLASNSIVATIKVNKEDLQKDLMALMRDFGLPIASSCSGQGACHKCVVNDCERSCMITTEDFISRYGDLVTITYL
jgi:ferredoxin